MFMFALSIATNHDEGTS